MLCMPKPFSSSQRTSYFIEIGPFWVLFSVKFLGWGKAARNEDFLSHLGTARARWLSLLQPLSKIDKSYRITFCFVIYTLPIPRKRTRRNTNFWLRSFSSCQPGSLGSRWLALQIFFRPASVARTALRNLSEWRRHFRQGTACPRNLTSVVGTIPSPRTRLCAVARQPLRQQTIPSRKAAAHTPPCLERVLRSEIFRRLSDFATACQERVFDRFRDIPACRHFVIFESTTTLGLRDVAPSFAVLEEFHNLAGEDLANFISGLRKLWAGRSAEVAKGQVQRSEKKPKALNN